MELIKPEVPNAQSNRGPDIFLEGLRGGLSFMAQMNQQRRQAESDAARLAFAERQAQESHELDRQRLDQAAQLIPSQIEANQAHASEMKARGVAALKGGTTAAQLREQSVLKKAGLLDGAAKDAAELEDVDFQTFNPVKFGLKVQDYASKYRFSPVPEIRASIKQYQKIADEQTALMKHGVRAEDGNVTASGSGVHVPLWKIALNAINPETAEQTMLDLEASGHMDVIDGVKQFQDNDKTVDVPSKTKTLKLYFKKYMQDTVLEPAAPVGKAPDYGPDASAETAKQYPVGTKARRGDQWFTFTEQGWQPVGQ